MKTLIILLTVCVPAAMGGTHTDVVDPSTEYQVIDNFGASDCWRAQKLGGWSDKNKHRIADLLFSIDKGIGLSCWRFNIGGGLDARASRGSWRVVETFEVDEGKYDWSRQANERWFLRAAKQRGVEQFVAFINSPPGRMTRNGLTYCDPGPHTTNLKPGYEKQYARYIVDILKHFRDASDEWPGIEFDWISPVNEPGWEWTTSNQEGNRAGTDDIKAIVKAIHAELARQNVKTRILAPEGRSPVIMFKRSRRMNRESPTPCGDHLKEFCGDPDVNKMLGNTICYHSYLADVLDTKLVSHRQRLGKAMARYPGWHLWQTEYCVLEGPHREGGVGRDLGMVTALNVARVIHYDLTLANVSAWQWWTAMSQCNFKDGLVYTDYRKPGDPETIHDSKLLWALGNFSRFIRPGMKRIGLTGRGHDKNGLLGSAYKDPKSGRIVIVYVNMADGPQEVRLSLPERVGGRRLERLTPYVTSDSPKDNLRKRPGIDLKSPLVVPGRSLVTLVAE